MTTTGTYSERDQSLDKCEHEQSQAGRERVSGLRSDLPGPPGRPAPRPRPLLLACVPEQGKATQSPTRTPCRPESGPSMVCNGSQRRGPGARWCRGVAVPGEVRVFQSRLAAWHFVKPDAMGACPQTRNGAARRLHRSSGPGPSTPRPRRCHRDIVRQENSLDGATTFCPHIPDCKRPKSHCKRPHQHQTLPLWLRLLSSRGP